MAPNWTQLSFTPLTAVYGKKLLQPQLDKNWFAEYNFAVFVNFVVHSKGFPV